MYVYNLLTGTMLQFMADSVGWKMAEPNYNWREVEAILFCFYSIVESCDTEGPFIQKVQYYIQYILDNSEDAENVRFIYGFSKNIFEINALYRKYGKVHQQTLKSFLIFWAFVKFRTKQPNDKISKQSFFFWKLQQFVFFFRIKNFFRLRQSSLNSTCRTSTWPRRLFTLLAPWRSGSLIIRNLSAHYYRWSFPAYRYILIFFNVFWRNFLKSSKVFSKRFHSSRIVALSWSVSYQPQDEHNDVMITSPFLVTSGLNLTGSDFSGVFRA